MPRPANRRAELAQIHMGAKALGMDPSDKDPSSAYRAALWSVARVHSAADLDLQQRQAVIAHFRALGWKSAPYRPTAARKTVAESKQGMINAIGALLNAELLSWEYATGIGRHMFGVEQLDWLTPQQTYKVLQALKVAARRRAQKAAGATAG